jgi:hypothetical protein
MKRQMVDMLADLVKVPSDSFSDKQEILDYVQTFTDQIHMRNTLFGDATAPALLAEYGQAGIVLSGHLDTPPIGDYWSFSQSQLASGRMYGRGAADRPAAKNINDRPAGTHLLTAAHRCITGIDHIARTGEVSRRTCAVDG